MTTSPSSPSTMNHQFERWRTSARTRDAGDDLAEHSVHAYFNTCPESPDGRWVLYYASSVADGAHGDLRIRERATGRVRHIAHIEQVEDAHRAACQQWIDGGRSIAYHDCRDGRWLVACVDLHNSRERILARDRQLGFGAPMSSAIPVYGCHWNPGSHRDCEMVDVHDGHIISRITIDSVIAAHRVWIENTFTSVAGLSIFFPVVSPNGNAVFFKVAKGRGGDDFRDMNASHRDGKIVWDLRSGTSITRFDTWGHPSWSADSSAILEKGNVMVSLLDGRERTFSRDAPSNHPSLSPDGSLFVTDADLSRRENTPDRWSIVLGSTSTETWTTLHRFSNAGGAMSWRHPHPHPVFSADGKRIYFNLSEGPWTRLQVLEFDP